MLTYNVLNDYVEKMKKNELTIVSTTTNIRTLTTADINKLKAGDIVLKEDETGKHAYVVSYKKDGTGICMTYTDATYVETISYDYNSVTKEWTYNSMDATEIQPKLTAGSNITIENNVISSTGSIAELYRHNFMIRSTTGVNIHYITIINNVSTAFTKTTLRDYLYSNGYTSRDRALQCTGRTMNTDMKTDYFDIGIYVETEDGNPKGVSTGFSISSLDPLEITFSNADTTVYQVSATNRTVVDMVTRLL